MRATPTSVAPDQSCQPSLDLDPPRIVALRLVIAVGGIEPDHAAFAAEGLESRFLIIDQGDDDFAVVRRVDLADQREIAVENSFLNHRITGNLERVMLARPKQRGRYSETFGTLQRLDGRAGGDPAVQRNL